MNKNNINLNQYFYSWLWNQWKTNKFILFLFMHTHNFYFFYFFYFSIFLFYLFIIYFLGAGLDPTSPAQSLAQASDPDGPHEARVNQIMRAWVGKFKANGRPWIKTKSIFYLLEVNIFPNENILNKIWLKF